MCELADIDSILKGELTESETIYWQTANKYIARCTLQLAFF